MEFLDLVLIVANRAIKEQKKNVTKEISITTNSNEAVEVLITAHGSVRMLSFVYREITKITDVIDINDYVNLCFNKGGKTN